jgi:queuine tRNA-ribosyltransferase subunit QTRTD1
MQSSIRLKPDITVGLGDVMYGSKAGIKRVEKMSDRTTDWITTMIAECKTCSTPPTNLFAPLLALDAQQQSSYLAFLQESQQDISGLAFYTCEVLLSLPAAISSLPRLALTEATTPHAVLSEISLGIDLHTIPFIATATDNGIALSFDFPAVPSLDTRPAPLGTDMWLPTHSTALVPLKVDCKCYSCMKHHRAYIQHLLVAKEMLGWVLLQIHNLAVIDRFYTGVRTAIEDNTFDEEVQRFEKVYERSWPEITGIGPRQRGYQFKSEGPGEKKKNVKAYGRFEDPALESSAPTDDGNLKPDVDSGELEKIGFAEKQ